MCMTRLIWEYFFHGYFWFRISKLLATALELELALCHCNGIEAKCQGSANHSIVASNRTPKTLSISLALLFGVRFPCESLPIRAIHTTPDTPGIVSERQF